MRLFENHFGRKQVYVFEGLFLAFTVFTYLAANKGVDQYQHNRIVWTVTASAISGPMAGAIARNYQSCCMSFSLSLLPYCGGALLLAALLQFLRLPFGRLNGAVRMTAWGLGVLIWFLGIPASFLHAFS